MNKLIWLFYAILVFLLIAGAVILFPIKKQLNDDLREKARLEQLRDQKRADVAVAEEEVEFLQSPEGVEQTARDKYSQSREGDVVYVVQEPAAAPSGSR